MSNLKALMQELLIETVLFYDSGNRSMIENGFCVYKSEGERRCAVGRILTDEAIERILLDERNTGFNASEVVRSYGPLAFLEKWRPIAESTEGMDFLGSLQNLHDGANNWNEKGISLNGEDRVRHIVKQLDLDLAPVLAAIEGKMNK